MFEPNDELNGGLLNFYGEHYQRHNAARLAHLNSLGLPLRNRTVLEVGAGPGHHTAFYVARACEVTATDARPECVAEIAKHYPTVRTAVLDMNHPEAIEELGTFEVIHCYGILYHLEEPARALAALASICTGLLLLETCVSPGDNYAVNFVEEDETDFTQSITARGCRPTRPWVHRELSSLFPFVYTTRTQPDHSEFPTNWKSVPADHGLVRSIFVASRTALLNSLLSPELLDHQETYTAPR